MITFNRSDIYAASNIANIGRANPELDVERSSKSQFQSGVASPDTVTISAAAREMANGNATEQVQHTYDNLAMVSKIATGEIVTTNADNDPTAVEYRGKPDIDIDNFYQNAMQSILDNRMGLDKEKLKEIEAMMEEVAKDESLSPEQKAKKLEELQELMDKVIEESVEKLNNQLPQ